MNSLFSWLLKKFFFICKVYNMLYSHEEWKSLCCKRQFIINVYTITMFYCIYITFNSNFFCSVCQSILLSGTFPVQCRPIWNACLHPHKSCCIPSPDLETLGQQQWEGTNGHAGQIYMLILGHILSGYPFLYGFRIPNSSKFKSSSVMPKVY